MTIEIVPIAPQYIESLHATLDIVAREHRYLAMLEAPPLEGVRAFALGNIEKRNPQFVAVDNGAVVGWCDVVRKQWDVQRHSGVLGMGLRPTHRGRGLGKALLTTTLAAARAEQFIRTELTVYVDNAPAIALYERVGFQREGVIAKCALLAGRYVDALLMALIEPDHSAGRS